MFILILLILINTTLHDNWFTSRSEQYKVCFDLYIEYKVLVVNSNYKSNRATKLTAYTFLTTRNLVWYTDTQFLIIKRYLFIRLDTICVASKK